MRISEAGKYLGVSAVTMRRYCNNGELKYTRTPNGQRTFTKEDLDELRNKKPENHPQPQKTSYTTQDQATATTSS